MKTDFYVYVLFDADGISRYVGKGRGKRWEDHERFDSRNRIKNAFVKRTLKKLGKIPKRKIRENLTEYEAFAIEIETIASIGRLDLGTGPLTNMSAGGTGGDLGIYVKAAKALWGSRKRREVGETNSVAMKSFWASLGPNERNRRLSKLISNSIRAVKRIREKNPNYDIRRGENISKSFAKRTVEEKAAATQKRLKTFPPEKISESIRKWHASRTPEERSATLKRGWANLTPEQKRVRAGVGTIARSEQVRRQQASLSIENQKRRVNRARAIAELNTGSFWANDGKINKRLKCGVRLPHGWVRGKIQRRHRNLTISGKVDLHV